jgi:short-subunit dehydrogenase involved in D-alanine esterification of teichoic acids
MWTDTDIFPSEKNIEDNEKNVQLNFLYPINIVYLLVKLIESERSFID